MPGWEALEATRSQPKSIDLGVGMDIVPATPGIFESFGEGRGAGEGLKCTGEIGGAAVEEDDDLSL